MTDSAVEPEVMEPERQQRAPVPVAQSEISATTLAAEMEALVKAKFAMAQHRPRDIDMARSRILKACRRPEFARAARYSKPLGGRAIQGPSIRFAEEAIRAMENIDVSIRTIYEDETRRKIRVDCIDLESNTGYSAEALIQKTVERRTLREGQVAVGQRVNASGNVVYLIEATEDDLLTKTNAIVSKAIRTQGLRLVPGDIVDEAMEECIKTARTADAEDPNAARRRILDGFDALNISPADLKAHLGIDPNKLSPKEIDELRELYRAIADGETTWRAVVDEKAAAKKPRAQGTKDAAKRAAEDAKGDTTLDEAQKRLEARKKDKPEVDPATGEEIPSDVGREPTQGKLA